MPYVLEFFFQPGRRNLPVLIFIYVINTSFLVSFTSVAHQMGAPVAEVTVMIIKCLS